MPIFYSKIVSRQSFAQIKICCDALMKCKVEFRNIFLPNALLSLWLNECW